MQIEAACGKVFASENAWFCVDQAIQIYGGIGFMRALPYERMLRDLRIFRIFEGTNEILRLMVGLTGIQTLGKELEPLAKAAKSPLANLGTLLPFAISQLKAKYLGQIEKPSLTWAPSQLRPAADVIETCTGEFGFAVQQLVMKHGKKIIDKQLEVSAVADVVIDLTAATAALSRAASAVESKSSTAELEVALANLFASEAQHRIRDSIKKFTSGAFTKDINNQKVKVAEMLTSSGAYNASHPTGL